MTDRPEPRPEGQLIAAALKAAGISAREAARRADISEVRWRQIVSGVQTVSGQPVPVVGPADTVARMARAVGLTSDAFMDVRDDVMTAMLKDEAAEAERRGRAYVADADEAYTRLRRKLGLLSPRQIELLEQVAEEFARTDSEPDAAGLPENRNGAATAS